MLKYHLSEKGEPAVCLATVKPCPVGGEHFDTEYDARRSFEESMRGETLRTVSKNLYEDLSLEDFGELEENVLREKRASSTPYDDYEYERHREYIRRAVKDNDSTHKSNTRKVKGKTVYTPERAALHEDVLKFLEEKYVDVPCEGRVVFMGGMPGSGKSTIIREFSDLGNGDYALINPDEAKHLLVARNGYPAIKGLLPMETNSLMQYESQLLTNELQSRLVEQGKNLLIDRTMMQSGPLLKLAESLKKSGYGDLKAMFVDVSTGAAYDRIISRHRKGLDDYVVAGRGLGARMVSGKVVYGSQPKYSNHKSCNAEALVELYRSGIFNEEPKVFDSEGTSPVEIEWKDFINKDYHLNP